MNQYYIVWQDLNGGINSSVFITDIKISNHEAAVKLVEKYVPHRVGRIISWQIEEV